MKDNNQTIEQFERSANHPGDITGHGGLDTAKGSIFRDPIEPVGFVNAEFGGASSSPERFNIAEDTPSSPERFSIAEDTPLFTSIVYVYRTTASGGLRIHNGQILAGRSNEEVKSQAKIAEKLYRELKIRKREQGISLDKQCPFTRQARIMMMAIRRDRHETTASALIELTKLGETYRYKHHSTVPVSGSYPQVGSIAAKYAEAFGSGHKVQAPQLRA